jgi:phosphoglycerol transferase MdoB-like AlkP superfamily enzyme
MTKPLYYLLILGLIVGSLYLFKNNIVRIVITSTVLLLQIVSNVGFIYLYDSNGTFFEWAMMNQRDDAFGTIEDLSLKWGLLALLCVLLVVYLAITIFSILYKNKKFKREKLGLLEKTIAIAVVIVSSIAMISKPIIDAREYSKLTYVERYLYGETVDKYQQLGMTSNAVYEFLSGTTKNILVNNYNEAGIEEFIYGDENSLLETSSYFGISKGNNLVYILVESFEWYAFLENCTPEQSAVLYPNLNKFLNSSIYANNFYAREKTDTAEMLSIIGSNPTNGYINYDFYKNEYSWSLPNLFRNSVEKNGKTIKQIKSFHQNDGNFYNRNALHENMGFDELVDIDDIEDYGVNNTWNNGRAKAERTLDSLTMMHMQDEMFPSTTDNEQYMTFWLTFSMHGYYKERKNLEQAGYYDKMDSVGAYPEGGTKANYLRTYAAAVMDFDKAVGVMMNKLEENGQLDNTTIVMFADHNTYYNNLSYYAKGIKEKYNSELYRVPFMIYDSKLVRSYVENQGNNVISKFTTTADMLPTILDIFGIKGYKNLYYGTSMFVKDVESIIFSRAYGIFVTDKLIGYSADSFVYTCEGFTKEDKEDFVKRAEILLNKQKYLDKIYNTNYFKKHAFINIE